MDYAPAGRLISAWLDALALAGRTACRDGRVVVVLCVSLAGVCVALGQKALPGYGWFLSRPLWVALPGVGLVWFSACTCLGAAYLRTTASGSAARATLCRVTGALASALALFALPHLFQGFGEGLHSRYVGKLWLAAWFLVALQLWLPGPTRDLAIRFWSTPLVVRNRRAIVLVLGSGLAVLGLQGMLGVFCHGRASGAWQSLSLLSPGALCANAVLLCAAVCVLYSLLNRFAAACFAGLLVAALFAVSSGLKMRYMHASAQPLDLLYLNELLTASKWYITPGDELALLLVALAAATVFRGIWRQQAFPLAVRHRLLLALAAAGTLTGVCVVERVGPLTHVLCGAGVRLVDWDSIVAAQERGMFLEFASQVPFCLVRQPQGYSRDAAMAVAARYSRAPTGIREGTAEGGPGVPASLIVYMVESLMDPTDLGVEFSVEPIPNLRRAMAEQRHGYAVAPQAFGGSANSEFEVLSGMAMHFLPGRSCPYTQYLKRNVPALPRLLSARSYSTTAVLASPRSMYNGDTPYHYLGFEKVVRFEGAAAFPEAASGNGTSDEAVVDAVIRACDLPGPHFVFAFTISTHSPYRPERYQGNGMLVRGAASPAAAAELSAYASALRDADAAIGRLFQHFSQSDRPTVIAVLGDHWPPLAAACSGPSARQVPAAAAVAPLGARTVPLLVWCNRYEGHETLLLSDNLLGSYLLGLIGVRASGWLALNDVVRAQFSVVSGALIATDGRPVRGDVSLASDVRGLLADYRLAQYDLLLGRQYALAQW